MFVSCEKTNKCSQIAQLSKENLHMFLIVYLDGDISYLNQFKICLVIQHI
jgi:hypothetical protein